jgi:hypothetical protein
VGFLVDRAIEHIVARDVCAGRHRKPSPRSAGGWFTTAYFHSSEGLGHGLAEAGFRVEAAFRVRPGAFRPELDAWLTEQDRRRTLLRAVRRVEPRPSVLGASAHLLAAGRTD